MALSKRKKRGTPQKPITGATSPTGRPSGFQPFNYQYPTPIQPPEPTLQPGQSVLPGSISLGGKPATHSALNPENVWWSYGEGTNALQLIWQLLNNSNNGGSLSQGYADILSQLTKQSEAGKPINPDMVISLLMNLLSYNTTQEQRDYDYRMLNESRQYNNPQNELARLMGAGISRDAALQLMSGSAGNLGSSSGAGATQMMSPVAGAGAAALNSSNAHNNLVNQVYNGIQLVANLFGQGVDMYSAIQSAQMLQAQNYMTQQQVGAYQQVNQVTQALQNAVTQGILEPTDLEGWSNANDVYKWLIDHADTNLVKPLNNSGAIAGVFGTTLGRDMFNKHWQQMRESKDAGKLFDNFVRQQELQSDLMSIQDANARRAYYTDFISALQDLIMNNEEIGILWNEYQSGQKIVSINGEVLKQQQYATNAARRQDTIDEVYFGAFESALDHETQMPDGSNVTGRQMINYHTFSGLMQQYMNDLVFTGKTKVHKWTDAEGHEIYGNARQRYVDYLNAHADAAITAAFVQELVESNHLNGLQGNFAPIYKFFDMWNSSGANQFVQTTAAGGAGAASLIRAFRK